MDKLPSKFSTFVGQLVYMLGVPMFFLAFVMLYRPVDMVQFFGMGAGADGLSMGAVSAGRLAFCATMLMCISLVVMMGSRFTMYFCRKVMHMNWFTYVLWCLAEVIVTSFFMALFMALMYGHGYPYFNAVGLCLLYSLLVDVFSYTIITLLLTVLSPAPAVAAEEDEMVRFKDNTQKLKLILAAPAILYVEADENYVKIVYKEGEKVLTYSLRSSMKAIGEMVEKHGMVRCQRSYFVNPQHIKALRRDKDGALYADLDTDGVKAIPVSAMYQQGVSEKL